MTLLIDTQCWLWAMQDPQKLSKKTRVLLEDPKKTILLSAASVWEITIKAALGKIRLPEDPETFISTRLREESYTELPVNIAHAASVFSLPPVHKDPFDRMLAAQARVESIPLLTADRIFEDYPIRVIWA